MKSGLGRFARFCLVGGVGLLINLAITHAGVVLFGLWYFWSFLLGVVGGWTSSFVLNAFFTFPEHRREAYGRKYALFIASYSVVFGLNAGVVYTLTSIVGVHYLVSITMSALLTTALSFWFNKNVIYKP